MSASTTGAVSVATGSGGIELADERSGRSQGHTGGNRAPLASAVGSADDAPTLSLAETRKLNDDLTRIAQRYGITELAIIVVGLAARCVQVAQRLTDDAERFTVTPRDYADSHNIPLRTVQWRCANHRIDAKLIDGKWRLPNDSIPESHGQGTRRTH